MKVDIRHTRHWDLENKLTSRVDGYQQFTCPLEWIQSMKRGLSRLQNLLSCLTTTACFEIVPSGFSHPQHSGPLILWSL